MFKRFIFLFVVIFILFVCVITLKPKANEDVTSITYITKFSDFAFSTHYLEHRNISYKDKSNIIYLGLKRPSRMDYVYAK